MAHAHSREDSVKDIGQSACLVRHLPAELLLRVFEFALRSEVDVWGFVVPSRSTAPLVLTWVCSSWRLLAISTQKLWTSVSLVSGSRGTIANPSNLLDLFIRRSGDKLPLSFSLNYDDHNVSHPYKLSISDSDTRGHQARVNVIANRLITVRHRWRQLILNVLVLEALEPFLHALDNGGVRMPMLEELVLSTTYTGFNGRNFSLPLKNCTGLRTVRVLSPRLCFDSTSPALELLTTLELQFCRSELDAIAWLSNTPNLECLWVELYASASREPINSSFPRARTSPTGERSICLPRLTRFSLTCFYSGSVDETLLDSLILPSLRSFGFTRSGLALSSPFLGVDRSESSQSIINLFARPGELPPPLQRLRLIDVPSTTFELRCILQHAGWDIRDLALGGQAVSDELVECLFLPRFPTLNDSESKSDTALPACSTRILCPNLESLELLEVDVSFSSIVTLAARRGSLRRSPPVLSKRNSSATPMYDSDVSVPGDQYSEFRTLKRLALLSEKFSIVESGGSELSLFPEGLDVVFV